MPLLEVQSLSKHFGDTPILKDVSFSVDKGEVIGIIGTSGSGKSTLLRCLNLLERPDGGTILMNGELVGQRPRGDKRVPMRESEILGHRAKVGMVFQSFNLFPHMTAIQNVMEAPIYVRGMSKVQAAGHAHDLLARVKLEDRANHYPHQLSGGQQQRVAIARALAMAPQLMLFDEPTSALDPELVGEVLQVMKDLARNGMTMILVSHEMGFIRDVADRVMFMGGGHILENAPPDIFFNAPRTDEAKRFLNRLHVVA
ncbi:hypothetical protein WM40_22900 [Robbsia andropogonis]|uniref:ABC transporter domain-containing protein n=1 Tax=Robbsia andropogonis TaxID=28092 RepID=A0A0F5JV12_9BURK|nr:amino acid ABC transporter ATP-binding protein [Robbsia andropogonis]KKB61510.1 hypothetical protein WM40_22900 [Robbsia andropogonis]